MSPQPDYDRSRTDDFGGPPDLQNAWQILAGGAPDCARALIHIAKYGRVEAARVAAAKTSLEMVGFTGSNDRPQINIIPPAYDAARPLNEGTVPDSVKVRERMKQLRAAQIVDVDPVYGQVVPMGEVVEAELVEE